MAERSEERAGEHVWYEDEGIWGMAASYFYNFGDRFFCHLAKRNPQYYFGVQRDSVPLFSQGIRFEFCGLFNWVEESVFDYWVIDWRDDRLLDSPELDRRRA